MTTGWLKAPSFYSGNDPAFRGRMFRGCGLDCCRGGNLSAPTATPGFTQTTISEPWPDSVGMAFENNGRTCVWGDGLADCGSKTRAIPRLPRLVDISEEVVHSDHGMLDFALNPNFRVNGYIYGLYLVGRH
jgi:hypothetical protein